MTSIFFNIKNQWKRCLSAYMIILLFLMTAGCSSHRITAENQVGIVPNHAYLPGTQFIYSDGTWETVIDSNSETAIWKNDRGYISSGSRDFTFRRSKQESRNGQWYRQFSPRKDLVFVPEFSLWPLADGRKSGFREDGQWKSKTKDDRTYTSMWSCRVEGFERVSVLSGDFDTWKIIGKRYSVKHGFAQKVKEIKTWYYAPQAGHPVLTVRSFKYDRPLERLELLAIVPPEKLIPPETAKMMKQSFQQCLESNKSGVSLKWGENNQEGAGRIVPLDTRQLKNGKYCRRYHQEIWVMGKKRNYYGIAFRTSKGDWVVPRKKAKK